MPAKFFYNIKELLTLNGAYEKKGRNITDQDLSIINNGGILENNGKILKVGTKKELDQHIRLNKLKVKKTDLKNKIVLPGFVDSHTHPIFECNRFAEFEKRISGMTYLEIAKAGGGIASTIKGTRAAPKTLLKNKFRKHLESMRALGTTTIEAKSGYGLSTESEIKMLEVMKDLNKEEILPIVPTFLGAHDFPSEYKGGKEDYYIDLVINEMLPKVKEKKLARFCDVFCDKGYYSLTQTEKIVTKAKDLGFEITLHVDELADTDGVRLALDLRAKSVSHVLCINSKNILPLAKSNATAIMLPGVPFFLCMGKFAPARALLDNGGSLAIATDFNPGSNMCYNMPLTITQASLFMKMKISESIVAGTLGGAIALGIEDKIGSISEGKDANFAVFDVTTYPEIFCHYGENHCVSTYVLGKELKRG